MAALLSEETEGKEGFTAYRYWQRRVSLYHSWRKMSVLQPKICKKMLFSGGKRTIIKVVLIITTGVFRRKQSED